MLGTWLFVAFWVLLGLIVFFIAVRGGVGGARATLQSQTRGARKTSTAIFVVIYVGFGVALPLLFLIGNHSNASAQVGGLKLTAAEKQGREVFGMRCGVCHTLAAANAVGKVGPNLDVIQPTYSLVIHTIAFGCLQDRPDERSDQLPRPGQDAGGDRHGAEAQEVAQFVSRVAGKE